MNRDTPLTLKEIIDVLTEIYKHHGDLEVSVNTQDGGLYSLWSSDNIVINKFDNGVEVVEIGG